MSEVTCGAKHCKFPIPEDTNCPKCGAKVGEKFYIQEPDEAANPDCSLDHEKDVWGCDKCEFAITGKNLSKMLQDRANMVDCPHCKGTGLVKRDG